MIVVYWLKRIEAAPKVRNSLGRGVVTHHFIMNILYILLTDP